MPEPIELPEGAIVLDELVITRYLNDRGDPDLAITTTGEHDVDLLALLGMLRLAEDTLIRDSMGEAPE